MNKEDQRSQWNNVTIQGYISDHGLCIQLFIDTNTNKV